MSDITKERWHYDAKTSEIRNERGDVMADGVGVLGPAFAVLPEALAELLETVEAHDSVSRMDACPCPVCVRRRDILCRAGVLK